MSLEVIVQGDRTFRRKMERAAFSVSNAEPFLHVVMDDIERIERALFSSQGRRGGGSWRGLSPETIAAKVRKSQDPRINIATGALLHSVSDQHAEYAVREVTRSSLRFGTTAPGAKQSQMHRPIFKFTRFDRARWAKWWGEYIVRYFR